MPFLHIRSLPLPVAPAMPRLLREITDDFAAATGVDAEHITVTWTFFEPGCHAVGGASATMQSADAPPLLIDLLAPDFNDDERIELMVRAAAASVASRAKVAPGKVFVSFRAARSGQVFDAGDIVRW